MYIVAIFLVFSTQLDKKNFHTNSIDLQKISKNEVNINFSGNGTKLNPYLIQNVQEFQGFAQNVDKGETYNDKYFQIGRAHVSPPVRRVLFRSGIWREN